MLRVHDLGLARREAEEGGVEEVGAVERPLGAHVTPAPARSAGSTPAAISSSSLKVAIDSTPSRRLRQNASASPAPGKRAARPDHGDARGGPRRMRASGSLIAISCLAPSCAVPAGPVIGARPGPAGPAAAPAAPTRGAPRCGRAPPACRSTCCSGAGAPAPRLRARPSIVGCRNRSTTGISRPSAWRSRAERMAIFSEVPPAVKKLSWTPICSTPQHLAPDGGDRPLEVVARRDVGHRGGVLRRRQGRAVELAAGGPGSSASSTNTWGTMSSGSSALQVLAQLLLGRAAGRPAAPSGARHHVPDQALLARHVLARRHHGLAHAGMADERRLDHAAARCAYPAP